LTVIGRDLPDLQLERDLVAVVASGEEEWC
jgi:hypothetical protein